FLFERADSRRKRLEEALVENIVAFAVEHPFGRSVEIGDAELLVERNEGVVDTLEDAREALCRLRPLLGRRLQIVDVGARAVPLDHAAFVVANGRRARLEPAERAVLAADAKLRVELVSRLHRSLPRVADVLALLRVELFQPPVAELLRLRN